MPLFPSTGWELLGYAILGSANNALSISNLPNRKLLMAVLATQGQSGNQAAGLQFNGDTGNNYTGGTSIGSAQGGSSGARMIWYHIFNEAASQKTVSLIGANTSAASEDNRGAWGNTSAAINRIDIIVVGGSLTWNTGSELWVFGLSV